MKALGLVVFRQEDFCLKIEGREGLVHLFMFGGSFQDENKT